MAMMNYDGTEVAAGFEKAFGFTIQELNESQLWWLVKVSKHIRGRCRNNAAFMNYMNRNFKGARFSEIEMEGDRGTYKKLMIVCKSREGV